MARPQSFESAKIESHFSWVTWADSSNFAVTWFNRVQVCDISVSWWFYEISFTLSYFFQTILAESYGGGVVWATLFRWQVLRNLQIWRKRRLDRLQVRTKFACNPIQAIPNDIFRCILRDLSLHLKFFFYFQISTFIQPQSTQPRLSRLYHNISGQICQTSLQVIVKSTFTSLPRNIYF